MQAINIPTGHTQLQEIMRSEAWETEINVHQGKDEKEMLT